jgi:hypothetical protein
LSRNKLFSTKMDYNEPKHVTSAMFHKGGDIHTPTSFFSSKQTITLKKAILSVYLSVSISLFLKSVAP